MRHVAPDNLTHNSKTAKLADDRHELILTSEHFIS